jgi:hypothetical protein
VPTWEIERQPRKLKPFQEKILFFAPRGGGRTNPTSVIPKIVPSKPHTAPNFAIRTL